METTGIISGSIGIVGNILGLYGKLFQPQYTRAAPWRVSVPAFSSAALQDSNETSQTISHETPLAAITELKHQLFQCRTFWKEYRG